MYVTYMIKNEDVKVIDTRKALCCFVEREDIRVIIVTSEYNKETKNFDKEYGIVLKQFFIKEKNLDEYMDWFRNAVLNYDDVDEFTSLYNLSEKALNALLEANLLDKFIEDEYSTALKYHPLEKEYLTVDAAKVALKFLAKSLKEFRTE